MVALPFFQFKEHFDSIQHMFATVFSALIHPHYSTAPDGVLPPRLSSATPTSLQVVWSAPVRNNAPGFPSYQLHMKHVHSTGETLEFLFNASSSFSYTAEGLKPYTAYEFRLIVLHVYGNTISDWAQMMTPEDKPGAVDPPLILEVKPRSVSITWQHPSQPNGKITGYNIYQNEVLKVTVASNSTSYIVTGLEPYTEYRFQILINGNNASILYLLLALSNAASFVKLTFFYEPGAVDPPLILEVKPRSVSITWQHPSQPNGKITGYNIYQNEVLKVTVASNSTSYIVTGLEPYTEYRFQVESCTSVGCSLSPDSHIIRTPPGPPEDIPAPQLYSETPTSVILAWHPPLRPNGVVKNFTVERRVKDTRQVSKVVTVQADEPLSYLDHSTALSPWTTYEYRIVVSIVNGGSNSSEWKEVTTRPSRPAGLEQPEVLVLGPYSVMVTWSPPLIPNGEILRYEIRMPDPHITITNTSELSYTVINLVPYTNYTVTVLACSGGGGHTGGCTESLPTSVTTLPTIPQGLSPLSVTIVSESFLVASWQPPSRPNGPNLRYELLRRKIRQPLASSPIEDLNRWYNIYSGDKLFYEDKGLSRYTAYDYKLLVHNDVGFASSNEVSSTTQAGIPIKGSTLMAKPLNHTAIQVDWTRPSLQDLQGIVEHYILFINSSTYNHSATFPAHVNYTIIGDLRPNTEYQFFIQVFNGAHNATSEVIRATTSDGEPEGVFPPEVVTLNSTAVRVIWISPSNPNGVVTEYLVYVNDRQHKTGMSSSGSFVLGGLLPFTIYNIQVEVCTVYACVKSNGTQITTVEDEPSDMVAPNVHVISSRSLRVDWTSPGRPNGIMLGYDVRRRTLRWCAQAQLLQEMQTGMQCLYVQCGINENICGGFCYQPEHQPAVQMKGISRGYPELMQAVEAMTQVMDWVYQELEAEYYIVERGDEEWCVYCLCYGHEEDSWPEADWNPDMDLEDEDPERPTPKWEEPECPVPRRGEPERPAPRRGEPECPQPKRGELECPQPKKGKPVCPEPKKGKLKPPVTDSHTSLQ
ncbi:UNVERIFIED_CONTAM: hypothetical protein FKN15_027140 [Acipenser sinensis]